MRKPQKTSKTAVRPSKIARRDGLAGESCAVITVFCGFLFGCQVAENKELSSLYIEKTSLSPYIGRALCVRTRGGGTFARFSPMTHGSFRARASPDGIGNSRAHRQSWFALSGFFDSLTRTHMEVC